MVERVDVGRSYVGVGGQIAGRVEMRGRIAAFFPTKLLIALDVKGRSSGLIGFIEAWTITKLHHVNSFGMPCLISMTIRRRTLSGTSCVP